MVAAAIILIVVALKPELTFFLIGLAYVTFGLLEAIPGFSKSFSSLRKKTAQDDENEDEDDDDNDDRNTDIDDEADDEMD